MLTSLSIKNFAIVSELELDFSDKMTAFTGETGAGKSIIIDALMLALGDRFSSSVVRDGFDKCEVIASFIAESTSSSALWLKNNDIEFNDGEIILRRVIYAEGRSKSYINGIAFPLNKVKELSEKLVNIHGQHQHQTLLNHPTHRKQLDAFANHSHLLDKTYNCYQAYNEILMQIENLAKIAHDADKKELLEYQITELNELALQDNEADLLHTEHQLLNHAHEYLNITQEIIETLQSESSPNIRLFLNSIMHNLELLPQDNNFIRNAVELIESAIIQCDEAVNEVTSFASKIQIDPARLSDIDNRMSEIHKMARKYQIDVKQLPNLANELQTQLDSIDNVEKQKIILEQSLKAALLDYESAALELRASRAKHAIKLAAEITKIITTLGMPKGFIEIEITHLDKIQPHGMDKVEYKVCTNPGMHLDSLSKIVSGGELSRISLAIQMITAQLGRTPTLIFDEVDVGIGGATSALVGKLLKNLGERLQVFCVTHQPQVASCAHHHFLVEKTIKNSQTFTHIKELKGETKVDEIARMLGGLTITEQTKLHALELINT